MYNTIPSIQEKDEFVVNLTQSVFDPNFKTDSTENIQRFVRDLVGFYVIMEGIFFYAGFAMMLALKRQNKMIGIGEQFEYIMRDESLHLAFGCDLIKTIRTENPEIWTDEFQKEIVELVRESVEFERRYAHDACPQGLLGINADKFGQYVEHIADRRLERLDLPKIFHRDNPFPLDVAGHRPFEGEELLRDSRDRIPDRWQPELGLSLGPTALSRADGRARSPGRLDPR